VTFAGVKAFSTRWLVPGLMLVVATAAATAHGQPQAAPAATHLKGSKDEVGRCETITGMLSGVDRAKGVIIVIRRGPHEPPSLQLSWTERVPSEPGGQVERSPITLRQVPGETDYDFRVTGSTLIEVNGARASLERLAALTNSKAKVRFTPRHDGDFALEIMISH
jgi:hypothetical protein